MEFVPFHHLNSCSNNLVHFSSKWFSAVASIDEKRCHPGQILFPSFHQGDCSRPIGDVGGGNTNAMRESLRINRNVSFNARNFFPSIIAFVFCGIRIFHTLGVNDAKAGFLGTTMGSTHLANDFFLALVAEYSDDHLSVGSISENNYGYSST